MFASLYADTGWRSLGSKLSVGLQDELNILYTAAPVPYYIFKLYFVAILKEKQTQFQLHDFNGKCKN